MDALYGIQALLRSYAVGRRMPRLFQHPKVLDRGGHIVRPDDRCAVSDRLSGSGKGAGQAILRGYHRIRFPGAGRPADAALAGNAHQDRQTLFPQGADSGQQLEVVSMCLAETESRIQHELGTPGIPGLNGSIMEFPANRFDHVGAFHSVRHVPRHPDRVHQYQRNIMPRTDIGQSRGEPQGRDVIDHVGACRQSGLRNVCPERVHRNPDVRPGGRHTFDHGQDAPHLLLGVDQGSARAVRRTARTGGSPSDVDQPGSLGRHPCGMLDGNCRVKEATSIGERVRRDIEHPHDVRASRDGQAAVERQFARAEDVSRIRHGKSGRMRTGEGRRG